ncbi:MAG: glycoside hydrolase family 2 [Bacteroidales bacterium]|nr:glycoside hydrolase family 2 [Bacteroidales bacterium]
MNRRNFILKSTLVTTGSFLAGKIALFPQTFASEEETTINLYEIFRKPTLNYHPFVRWWWNGNKVEAGELISELRLLKAAGIGGVEINPVEFPKRSEGDDLGKPSLKWLSEEWIDMLSVTFKEAKSLGLTCDLIVGSGWPFGAENLQGEERSQVVVIAVKKITGPAEYEISKFELFKEADPAVSSPFPGRTMELLSLKLVTDPLININNVIDLHDTINNEVFKISIPEGKHALYALIRIDGFMQVINGAPGATGPVLNHYNEAAVKKYLTRMSSAIESKTGKLSGHIRALFTDSLELEGANWFDGIMDEFRKRRGYDIFPWLPFVLFKTGAMGNVTDFKYGVTVSPELEKDLCRMRYDFEITKAELLEERFIKPYTAWCRELNVKSRAQAYGRGFFPLESSFDYDIPESESWTMNWLKHKVGEEMPEEDYRRGRAYTMINKFVSSAANLTGKRIVSCEEMTDTYTVFNTSLENLKIGGDQSAITGVNHSVFHGFNYSPPEAPYPGWIRYGGYYNEKNTWWPWFHLYNDYKGRMSALLQNVTMVTDIAILPPVEDMWSLIGSQMEPFPSITHVEYMTLVWEAMNKNGHGCDYVSQNIISQSLMKEGFMSFGPRKYHSIFLIQVDSLNSATADKLLNFIAEGGRIFCIETIPFKSLGYKNYPEEDQKVKSLVQKMKSFPDRFIFLKKPEKNFISWFTEVQKNYNLKPNVLIEKPDPYVYQNCYKADDGSEMIYLINSHLHNSYQSTVTFSPEITRGRNGWIWEAETGNRYRIFPDKNNSLEIDLGPAESRIFIFDKNSSGTKWKPLPVNGSAEIILMEGWKAEFIHCRDGSGKKTSMNILQDLKDLPEFAAFAGTITYSNTVEIIDPENIIINLGKVYGLSELKVNGENCGAKWYGRRIYNIGKQLRKGSNIIEITVATSMGNYMKSLTDNPIAQYWTNEKNKIQPVQSMGLIGPVTLYKKS